jgi:hypothetical protein
VVDGVAMSHKTRVHRFGTAVRALAAAGLVGAVAPANAIPRVTARLMPEKSTALPGDSLRFELRFANTGTSPARIWLPVEAGVPLPMALRVHGPEGTETILRAASYRAVYTESSKDCIVLGTGDSTSLLVGIGGRSGSVGPRGIMTWENLSRGRDGVWDAEDVFRVPGEYTVSLDYDLRGAREPRELFRHTGLDTTSAVPLPLYQELLRTNPVRVTILSHEPRFGMVVETDWQMPRLESAGVWPLADSLSVGLQVRGPGVPVGLAVRRGPGPGEIIVDFDSTVVPCWESRRRSLLVAPGAWECLDRHYLIEEEPWLRIWIRAPRKWSAAPADSAELVQLWKKRQ